MIKIMYIHVCRIGKRPAGNCKIFTLLFVNFSLARSYACPLRELAVPTGQ